MRSSCIIWTLRDLSKINHLSLFFQRYKYFLYLSCWRMGKQIRHLAISPFGQTRLDRRGTGSWVLVDRWGPWNWYMKIKNIVIIWLELKVAFFQKVWCIFLITQKMCRKLSWKRYFEIAFCLESADSNCTAVSKGRKIQNTKLRIEHSTFFGQWKL